MLISKKFKFEAAHKLSSAYDKKCMKIHGHSYVCELAFFGGLNADGVVIDFTRIKESVQPIFNFLDHTLLLDGKGDQDLVATLEKYKMLGLRVCSFNPTAENLALFICKKILMRGQSIVANSLHSVSILETCSSKVEIRTEEIKKYNLNALSIEEVI